MKLQHEDLINGLKKLALRYCVYFDNTRLVEMADAYLDVMENIEKPLFLKAVNEFCGEKFPTAVELLRKCKDIQNPSVKIEVFKIQEQTNLATRESFLKIANQLKKDLSEQGIRLNIQSYTPND